MDSASLALAIAVSCMDLAKRIFQFVNETREAPCVVAEFGNSITTLRTTLEQVAETFTKRSELHPFEVKHHHDVHRILISCKHTLHQLKEELPQFEDRHVPPQAARAALKLSLAEGRIKKIESNISTYTEVLQLSVTTIFLGSLWETQESQEEVREKVRNLTNAIRSSRPVAQALNCRGSQGRMLEINDYIIDQNISPTHEVQAWGYSADRVATAITLHEFDPDAILTAYSDLPSALSRNSSFRLSTIVSSDYEGHDFDPEPDRLDYPSKDVLQHQFTAIQTMVKRLVDWGIYRQASLFQKKGIQIREDLSRVYQAHFPFEDQTVMKELLAEIYLGSSTEDGMNEAALILQRLLTQECGLPAEEQSMERRARLYHKLGELMIQLDDLKTAIKFLGRALEDRTALTPYPIDDVIRTTDQLVKAHQLKGEWGEAQGFKEWMQTVQQEFRPLPPLPPPEPPVNIARLETAIRWCKSLEFDTESQEPTFESLNAEQNTTPLHKAVEKKAVDIVEIMLDYEGNVNHGQEVSLPALILVAASTRDKDMVNLLLERGAEVNVRDKAGMTPLHRCQSISGGTEGGLEVAKLLIDRWPAIVNAVDEAGKTALFMASEKGNAEMVKLLLNKQADPNICHQNKALQPVESICTPLIAAIQFTGNNKQKIDMVEALLSNGADPKMKDVYGNDATFAANNAGLTSQKIKSLIQKYTPPCDRRLSQTSARTTLTQASKTTNASIRSRLSRFSFVKRRSSNATDRS
ncbi:Fc.00g014280.m01.CDS01 [Cosmosporella sp. VM-42]